MDKKQDSAQVALVAASVKALARAKKKPVTFAVARILKKNRFSPLSIFINQVFPMLKPEDQAASLFKLMDFIYPKVSRLDADGRKKKGPSIQVNTQVVNSEPHTQQQLSLADLLKLASGDDQK